MRIKGQGMTSKNDPNAQRHFDAARDTLVKGELAGSYNEQSDPANSREQQAVRQKSSDLKAEQEDFSKVLSGAIDEDQSVYSVTASAAIIANSEGGKNGKGKKKNDLTLILEIQAMNDRIASLDAGFQAYQNIFDNYTDEQICAGEHLNEDGKFKDPKAEEYWQKYCELNGLDPSDQELRKDSERLHAVQDWIAEDRRAARADLDSDHGSNKTVSTSDQQSKLDADVTHEASFEVATETAPALKTEEQELKDFSKIRADGMFLGHSEDKITKAEKDEFQKLSDDAKDSLTSIPENKYLLDSNKTEPEQKPTLVSENPLPVASHLTNG